MINFMLCVFYHNETNFKKLGWKQVVVQNRLWGDCMDMEAKPSRKPRETPNIESVHGLKSEDEKKEMNTINMIL